MNLSRDESVVGTAAGEWITDESWLGGVGESVLRDGWIRAAGRLARGVVNIHPGGMTSL